MLYDNSNNSFDCFRKERLNIQYTSSLEARGVRGQCLSVCHPMAESQLPLTRLAWPHECLLSRASRETNVTVKSFIYSFRLPQKSAQCIPTSNSISLKWHRPVFIEVIRQFNASVYGQLRAPSPNSTFIPCSGQSRLKVNTNICKQQSNHYGCNS